MLTILPVFIVMNIIIIFIWFLSAACSSTDVPVWHSPCQQSIKCASHHHHHHQGRDQEFFVCVSSLANPLFWMHIPILASPTVGEQDCAADNCCPHTHKQDDQMDLSAFAWFARFVKHFLFKLQLIWRVWCWSNWSNLCSHRGKL